ncbi:MAG: hypothetical protein KDB00_24135 [Planctomycetales bacterium]|nr:hypothetical protein [Planctomycetales bacterium]
MVNDPTAILRKRPFGLRGDALHLTKTFFNRYSTTRMPDLSVLTTFVGEHKTLLSWFAVISGILFVGCLLVVPWLVTRIPSNYFLSDHRPKLPFADRHPVLRWTGLIAKNLVGGILIAAGVAMLILPGQGILTMVMGGLLLDFPGKHRLERRVIRIKFVLRSINWLRHRSGVEPIKVDSI